MEDHPNPEGTPVAELKERAPGAPPPSPWPPREQATNGDINEPPRDPTPSEGQELTPQSERDAAPETRTSRKGTYWVAAGLIAIALATLIVAAACYYLHRHRAK